MRCEALRRRSSDAHGVRRLSLVSCLSVRFPREELKLTESQDHAEAGCSGPILNAAVFGRPYVRITADDLAWAL